MSLICASGCFDLLHPGHIAFIDKVAKLASQLVIFVARDETVYKLKGCRPLMPDVDRLKIVRSLQPVTHAELSEGIGMLDFEKNLRRIRPEYFAVNPDGDVLEKRHLCEELDVDYLVMEGRNGPYCSTNLRNSLQIPYRVDIAGAWLDQPPLSLAAGIDSPVITVSILADQELSSRCGLADSTRAIIRELWGSRLPVGPPEDTAKLVFGAENPPGSKYISGSQDSLGICLPGVNFLYYEGQYWPSRIQSMSFEVTEWLETRLWLVKSPPRPRDFNIELPRNPNPQQAKKLAQISENVADAIRNRSFKQLCIGVTAACRAQISLMPKMLCPTLEGYLYLASDSFGVGINGAGGGGYLTIISEQQPPDGIPVRIRKYDLL